MGQLAIPMMIGAAVGGGSKLLQGKGIGDILKGGLIGGATGGVTGGLGNALGGVLGSAGTGAVGAASNAGLGQAGITGLQFGTEGLKQGVNLALPTVAESGIPTMLASDFAPKAIAGNLGTPISLAGGGINLPASIGTELANNNIGSMPNAFNEKLQSMYDKYGTVQNVTGAGNLAMKYADMNKPRQMQAQSGQISRGQAPTMEGLLALQQAGYGLPQRRKIDLGLIG